MNCKRRLSASINRPAIRRRSVDIKVWTNPVGISFSRLLYWAFNTLITKVKVELPVLPVIAQQPGLGKCQPTDWT
jgi:hypothetical protein